MIQEPPFLCLFKNSLTAKKVLTIENRVLYPYLMSSLRDSPYPVAHNQWVEGVKAPTNCRSAVCLGVWRIDERIFARRVERGVFAARNNGECRVKTAVSLIPGYRGAVAHGAPSITRGGLYGKIFFQRASCSKMAVMGEGILGPVAQNPASSQIGDTSWARHCLVSTAV